MTENQKKISIAILMLLISIWHYSTSVHQPFLHILHRELYLLPIGIAAYWFGTRGGLLTAGISIALFLPKIMEIGHGPGTYNLNNFLAIPTFLLLGYFVGKYRDIRKNQLTTLWTKREEPIGEPESQNILLCIDNSKNAFKAAWYVAQNFSGNSQAMITVMGFIREPSHEFYSNQEEQDAARTEVEESIVNLVESSKEVLLNSGFPPDAVRTRIYRLGKESITSKILEEQKSSQYTTLVIGGTKMSKTEEFVLGNKAVKLVREADCSVITVF